VGQALQVPLKSCPGLQLAVANEDRVPSSGFHQAVDMTIGGEQFSVDCFELELGGYDMVLGVQWLGTLGPILWDFTRQTMCFSREGRQVIWTGSNGLLHPSAFALSPMCQEFMTELL